MHLHFCLSACIQSFLLNVSELQIPAYWGNSQLQVPPPCRAIWDTTSSALHLSRNMRKLKKSPNKQNQTPRTSHRHARNLNPDLSGFKPSSLVKSAQFNRVEDILQWNSALSVSIKYLNLLWVRAGVFIPDWCFLGMISHQDETVWFFPLWPKEHLKILCKVVPLIVRA